MFKMEGDCFLYKFLNLSKHCNGCKRWKVEMSHVTAYQGNEMSNKDPQTHSLKNTSSYSRA